MQDLYTWAVTYDDGTVISEEQVQDLADVDVVRARVLDVLDAVQRVPVHRILLPQGASPVYVRRHRIVISLASGSEEDRGTVYGFGWKQGEQGVYLFVFSDGSTLLTDDFQAV